MGKVLDIETGWFGLEMLCGCCWNRFKEERKGMVMVPSFCWSAVDENWLL